MSLEKIREVLSNLNGSYEYSTTQFNLPKYISRRISNWGRKHISDEWLYQDEEKTKGRENEYHVTLLYGIHTSDPTRILELVKDLKPIKVKLGKVEKFEKDEYDVLKLPVIDESGELEKLWNEIKKAEEYTSNYDKKYEPHCTICYVKKGMGDELVGDTTFDGDEIELEDFKFRSADGNEEKFVKLSIQNSIRKNLDYGIYTKKWVEKNLITPLKEKGYKVELVGSIATKGFSNKDIDLLLYLPQYPQSENVWNKFNKDMATLGWTYIQSAENDEHPEIGIIHGYEDAENNWLDVFIEEEQMEKKAINLGGTPTPVLKAKDGVEIDIAEEHGDLDIKQLRQFVNMYVQGVFDIDGYNYTDLTSESQQALLDWFKEPTHDIGKMFPKKAVLDKIVTVYHGSRNPNIKSVEELKADPESSEKMYGTGIYFSSSENGARQYGENIIMAQVDTSTLMDLTYPMGRESTGTLGTWQQFVDMVNENDYNNEGVPDEKEDELWKEYHERQDEIREEILSQKYNGVIDRTQVCLYNLKPIVKMNKTSKHQFILQLASASDLKRALEAINKLTYNTPSFEIENSSLIFDTEDDLQDIKTLLQKNGVMGLEKRSAKELLKENDWKFVITALKELDESGLREWMEKYHDLWIKAHNKNMEYQRELSKLLTKKNIKTAMATTKYYALVNTQPVTIEAGDDNQAIEKGKQLSQNGENVEVIRHNFDSSGLGSKEKIWQSGIEKTMKKITKTNFLTGEEEVMEVEPQIVEMFEEEIPEGENTIVTQECQQIDPDQSKETIKSQLSQQFHTNYPNALTYQNIFNCAEACGLTSTLDKYDLIGIMNAIATEVGLPKCDFSNYFPEDDITEDADIQGNAGHVEYSEGDLQGAVKDFMEGMDNTAEALYEIDRVLEERLKMLTDTSKIVEASKEVIRDTVRNIRKDAMVNKYLLSDLKVTNVDRAGRIHTGKFIYKISLRKKDNLKINRTIDVELPIAQGIVQRPTEFSYKNDKFPLEAYFLNDVLER